MKRTISSVIVALAFAASLAPARAEVPAVPIPQDPRAAAPVYVGAPAVAQPVETFDVPRHPFMAANGTSNLHNDAYMTDAYTTPGPLGHAPTVTSTFHVAECASVTFDRAGRIVTICVGFEGPRLVLMDPVTLATLAVFPLPPRTPTPGTGTNLFNDFSGGGYFYLDAHDRAVLSTNTREIWIVGTLQTPAGPTFALHTGFALAPFLIPGEAIVSALPDWNGRIWFAGTRGTVGVVDPRTGGISHTNVNEEVIANSFAVDETGGVFIVSDHALYRFDADDSGAVSVTWRETYDRGMRVKPGQVSQGSGTTPTLMGTDYVAITDNADARMRVLVYRRGAEVNGPRLVCAEPVFAPYTSASDNSLVAFGNSLIVENNYGYSGPTATTGGLSTTPGLARVDFTDDGHCSTAWVSNERAPSVVPKVSTATGLLYTYTKNDSASEGDAWYFTAIDVRTGATVFKRKTGHGLGFNNNYAPVSLGPDGAAYVGVLGGLVRIADQPFLDN